MNTESNKIICGDCVNVIRQFIPNNCIDLIVTSPPYDNLRDYDEPNFKFENIAINLFAVLKWGGVIVWIVGDQTINGSESGTSFKQALYFKSIGFNLHDTMIYAKRGFANPSLTRYHQIFEYMFVFSKGKPKTFNPLKDRPNIEKKRGGDCKRQKDGTMVRGNQGGLLLSEFGQRFNIWQYKIGGGNISSDRIVHNHPAAFPEQLAIDHILSWSNEGDLVLDPMCGSGTTCVAAELTNRKWIGIDISEKYCQIARERIVRLF
jgi:site-specific DNA-methyltransferase (adenine-specific)